MDENNNQNIDGQQGPSKKQIEKQDSRDVVNTVGKEVGKGFLEANGVPPVASDMVVDKLAEHPYVKHKLNKVADNPLLKKGLSNAKPLVDAAKPLLNAKGGSFGKNGAGALKSTNAPLNNADPKMGMPKANNPFMNGFGASSNSKVNADSAIDETDATAQEPTSGVSGIDTAKDIANTAAKVKQYWPIISAVAPVVGYILLTILAVIVIMIPIMFVRDKIEAIKTGIVTGWEKVLNLATGDGWNTNEEAFFRHLQKEYNRYYSLQPDGEQLDIPLIAATIHYSRIPSAEGFKDGEVDGSSYDAGSSNVSVQKDQMRSFYEVANDKLGSMFSIVPGQRRLLGHLVRPEISIKMVPITDAGSYWSKFGKFFIYSAEDTLSDAVFGTPTSAIGFINFWNSVAAYAEMNQGKVETDVMNVVYEAKEFMAQFANIFSAAESNEVSDEEEAAADAGGWILKVPVPVVTLVVDEDNSVAKNIVDVSYKAYLENIYIPLTYFHNKTYTKGQVTQMAKEIFDQRDAYEYLIKDYIGVVSANCGNCSYSINGINNGGSVSSYTAEIANLQVRLMQCSDLGTGTPISGEELVPFEKYITGVVYAENGGAPLEAMKAQAVAARSYALSRPKLMGDSAGLSLEQEDGQWILQIRNCTEDQVYCDPDKGCSTESSTSATTFSGEFTKPNRYKGPIASDDPIRVAVAETSGKIILDEDGNVVNAPYVSTDQDEWNDLADSGKSYTEILLQHYSSSASISASSCSNNCGAIGDFSAWKQFGEPWSDIIIGSGETIGKVGCLVTSVAMQIARSGVAVNIADFNPGSFVEALKAQNQFSGANFSWYSTITVAPTFQFQNKYSLGGDEATKLSVVKGLMDEGCYVVMEVKGNTGQHWVAVDYIDGSNIYMMDPASTETNLWNRYPSANSSTAACYKVIN